MTNPTTNFGWVMPQSSDLVTDLPADFNVFGQGVDTSMADLLGGTTGQILAKASATNMDFTWITNDVGDITAVTVTAPITGGGTSGSVGIGISAASTSASGAVQLSDSTSTTSSVLAATSTAVKAAYDKASTAATTLVAGIVQLSDSTSTTSSVLAATPTAVKTTYDTAVKPLAQYPYVTGRYYSTLYAATRATTTAIAAGITYYAPIYIRETRSFAKIGLFTSGTFSGTASMRIGIYNSNASGAPSTVFLDAGTVAPTAASTEYSITVNTALTPGLYWLAMNTITAATTNIILSHASQSGQLPYDLGLTTVNGSSPLGYSQTVNAASSFATAVSPAYSLAYAPYIFLVA